MSSISSETLDFTEQLQSFQSNERYDLCTYTFSLLHIYDLSWVLMSQISISTLKRSFLVPAKEHIISKVRAGVGFRMLMFFPSNFGSFTWVQLLSWMKKRLILYCS